MDSKKDRVERHRLIAGFIETVPLDCITCKKDIEFDYVERQLSGFKTDELRNLMKSKKELGLFCCNCYNKQNRKDYDVWDATPQTRRAPIPSESLTARDVHVSIGETELRNIIALNLNSEFDPPLSLYSLGAPITRVQSTIEMELIQTAETTDLCGKTIKILVAGQDQGRYVIEAVDMMATPDSVIRVRVRGHKINE